MKKLSSMLLFIRQIKCKFTAVFKNNLNNSLNNENSTVYLAMSAVDYI